MGSGTLSLPLWRPLSAAAAAFCAVSKLPKPLICVFLKRSLGSSGRRFQVPSPFHLPGSDCARLGGELLEAGINNRRD